MLVQCENPVEVAKEAFWLAWQACGGPAGMGVLQDRGGVTRDDVWKAVSGQEATDYVVPQGGELRPYGDYVFGRMMKLGMDITSEGISVRDSEPRWDYQAWCSRYPTYESLIAEAAIAVGSPK